MHDDNSQHYIVRCRLIFFPYFILCICAVASKALNSQMCLFLNLQKLKHSNGLGGRQSLFAEDFILKFQHK
jgi:hypothetical protein